jgi:hypothetical protein
MALAVLSIVCFTRVTHIAKVVDTPLVRNTCDLTTQGLTFWCSSPRPTSCQPFFAIGTSDGLRTLTPAGAEWRLAQVPFTSLNKVRPLPKSAGYASKSEVMSVDWLTPDVVVSGLRDSTVVFSDLRSMASVIRLQHPYTVEKIRRIDQHRLVAAGYQSVWTTPRR